MLGSLSTFVMGTSNVADEFTKFSPHPTRVFQDKIELYILSPNQTIKWNKN